MLETSLESGILWQVRRHLHKLLDWGIVLRLPAETRDFSKKYPDKTESHPTSYSLGTWVPFPKVKRTKYKTDNSCNVEVKNEWSCPSKHH